MNHVRASAAAALAAVLAVGASCARLAPAPVGVDAAPADLFPLAAGRAWVYEVRDASGRASSMRVRVRGSLVLDSLGTEATLVEESGGVPGARSLESSIDLVAYYTREGVLFRLPWNTIPGGRDDSRFAKASEPVLPRDVRRLPTWRGEFDVLAIEGPPLYELSSESRLTAAAELVSVPAGRFPDCVRVDTRVAARAPADLARRQILYYYTDWYAPGVGLVKERSAVDVDGRPLDVLWAELTAFEPRR
jgi:hypothetical protein